MSREKIPKKVALRLGRARRLYVRRLLDGGMHGNDVREVVETVFCRGLQECVPAQWMRNAARGRCSWRARGNP